MRVPNETKNCGEVRERGKSVCVFEKLVVIWVYTVALYSYDKRENETKKFAVGKPVVIWE